MTTNEELAEHLNVEFDQRNAAVSYGVTVFLLVELTDLPAIKVGVGVETAVLFVNEFHYRARQLARNDDNCYRIAEDRVALVLQQIKNTQQIKLAAAKLARLFEEPMLVLNESLRVKLAAAFVVPTKQQTSADEILESAEQGILQAKRNDEPYVVLRPGQPEEQNNDWQIQRDVEAAFDRGEFVLYYQPQIHASYGSLVGAEALLRWISPDAGVVSPGAFIPYIENAPIIRPLTWFAIKSALSKCRGWSEGMTVSVNVATELLKDDEIVTVTRDAVRLYELDPARLTLEITESGVMQHLEKSSIILNELRDLGVGIAIDDFGTGYSSLAYFRDLPANELKIDRSFVHNMCNDPREEALVRTIVDLAHNFGLQVVGEGVEDRAQPERLKALGCDILQGYFFGKPMGASDFALHAGNKR